MRFAVRVLGVEVLAVELAGSGDDEWVEPVDFGWGSDDDMP